MKRTALLAVFWAGPVSAQMILTEPADPCQRLAAAIAADHVSPPWYPALPALGAMVDASEPAACEAAFDLVLRVEGPLARYKPTCAQALLAVQDAAGSRTLERMDVAGIVAAAAGGATATCAEALR